jgi:hypothetical protein
VWTMPRSPPATAARTAAKAGSNRRGYPIWTWTSAAATRRASRTASRLSWASGFSQKVGRPAATHSSMSSPWNGVGAAMTTPSTADASTASGLSATLAPYRPETCSASAGTGSLTTSSSTAGRPDRVPA